MLKILIIGYGSIAKKHLIAIERSGYIAKVLLLRRSLTQEPLPSFCDQTDSLRAALDWNPTHSIICTPTSAHLEYVDELCSLGVKILIEKPLTTLDSAELPYLEEMALRNDFIFLAYPYRFHAMAALIRASQEKGKPMLWMIDRGYNLEKWQGKPYKYEQSYAARADLGGGALLTLCHELDMFISIFGMPSDVSGHQINSNILGITAPDLAVYTLRWGKFISASFRIDMLRNVNHLDIVGISKGHSLHISWDSQPLSSSEHLLPAGSGEMIEHRFSFHDFHQLYYLQMMEFLCPTSNRLCTLSQGIDSIRVMMRIKGDCIA